jgi:hypothetical protein
MPLPIIRRLEQRLSKEKYGAVACEIAKIIVGSHGDWRQTFCVCRRALIQARDNHDDPEKQERYKGLRGASEWAIRMAILLLEECGFLDRKVTFIKKHPTKIDRKSGKPIRKPIEYRIGITFMGMILAARTWLSSKKSQALPNDISLQVTSETPSPDKEEIYSACIWERESNEPPVERTGDDARRPIPPLPPVSGHDQEQ